MNSIGVQMNKMSIHIFKEKNKILSFSELHIKMAHICFGR